MTNPDRTNPAAFGGALLRFTFPIATLSIVACASAAEPSDEAPTFGPPLLQSPVEGARIRQNDPTTGCFFDPSHGYGFQIAFDWSDVHGAASYHIYAIGPNATIPIVDTVVTESRLFHRRCNSYVIDGNLANWRWRVASVRADGSVSEWSAFVTWDFDPVALPPAP